MPPKLYWCPESGNCYKVRLLASLLDLELERVELDFFNNAHKDPKFLALNPKGQIPVLLDGENVFTDSSAILVYIAGTYGGRGSSKEPGRTATSPSYWSTDVIEQAKIVDWLAFTAAYIGPGLSRARAIVAFKWPVDATQEMLSKAQDVGVTSLKILETRLSNEEWLVCGRPTVADIANFVYVALAPMGNVSLEPFPGVRRWVERMKSLPGFVSLHGLDQPF